MTTTDLDEVLWDCVPHPHNVKQRSVAADATRQNITQTEQQQGIRHDWSNTSAPWRPAKRRHLLVTAATKLTKETDKRSHIQLVGCIFIQPGERTGSYSLLIIIRFNYNNTKLDNVQLMQTLSPDHAFQELKCTLAKHNHSNKKNNINGKINNR